MTPPPEVQIQPPPPAPPCEALREAGKPQPSEEAPSQPVEQVQTPTTDTAQASSADRSSQQADRSPGRELVDKLNNAQKTLMRTPIHGGRQLPILDGLSSRGCFDQPQENVLVRLADLLIQANKLYRYQDSIVIEIAGLNGQRSLLTLRSGSEVAAKAHHALGSLVICQQQVGKDTMQFPLPQSVAQQVLDHPQLLRNLPIITTYSVNPIFNEHFEWCDNGWYESSGTMVHGQRLAITPYTTQHPSTEHTIQATGSECEPDAQSSRQSLLARLPHHLRTVLADFCFEDGSDLANTIAALLTLLLRNHFVVEGKAMLLLLGNQPGVGKTLLARVLSTLADGEEPMLIAFHEQEQEMVKQIGSHVRNGCRGVLLLDNARSRRGGLDMPTLEGFTTSPVINPRLLGQNELVQRPNDVLWTISSNGIAMTPDLLSRSFSIRLKYEGRPEDRGFQLADPIRYAQQHRAAILSELAGMVYHWLVNSDNTPAPGSAPGSNKKPQRVGHRFTRWAQVIGGILQACGVHGFLGNQALITQEFNSSSDELVHLAEEVLIDPAGPWFDSRKDQEQAFKPARDWQEYFARAELNGESNGARSRTAAVSTLGRQLSQWVDREVNVLLSPGNGSNPNEANRAAADASGDGEWFKVSLKQRTQRGRKRIYALHVTPDLPAPGSFPGSTPGSGPGSFGNAGSSGGTGSWPGPMPGW